MVIEAEHSLFCPTCRRQYESERTVCPSDGAELLTVPFCYPRPGNVFDSRYVLLETIGKGGMATIYRGYDAQARCECALKVLKVKFTSEERAVAQFFMEARLARMLSHPNIVRILDFGMTQVGYLYIAMDLLHGSTLSALIRNEGPMKPARAVGIFAQVVDALAAAHEQGTIHRDLKPENIFISNEDGRDVVKLLDFGIAQFAGTDSADAKEVCGTPAYMSPEQIRGKEARPETDLYSAGIVLFEMLAGSPPFTGASPMDILRRQLKIAAPRLAEVNSDCQVSRSLEKLALHMMLKKPAMRPRSAAIVRDCLSKVPEYDASLLPTPTEDFGLPVGTITERPGPAVSYRPPEADDDPAQSSPEGVISSRSGELEHYLASHVRPGIVLEEKLSIALDTGKEKEASTKDKLANRDCAEESYTLLHARFVPLDDRDAEATGEELRMHMGEELDSWFEFIERRGGLVCYDSGGDLKVLFGYLTEDPDFACRALESAMALSICLEDAVRNGRSACGVRMGVASGAVFTDDKVEGPLDWLIRGSQVDLAVRLSRVGPVGGVVTCQATTLLAHPNAETHPLARIMARGGKVIQTFLLTGVSAGEAKAEPDTSTAPAPPPGRIELQSTFETTEDMLQ